MKSYKYILLVVISLLINLITNEVKAYPLDLHNKAFVIAEEAPRPWFDDLPDTESLQERKDRLNIIVMSAVIVSSWEHPGWKWGQKEMLALLLATSYEEGWRWHIAVHTGKKRGDKGKAACINQLHSHFRMFPRELWKASMGTNLSSTIICMEGAARWFAYYSDKCVSEWQVNRDLHGAFTRIVTGYGTGRTCSGYPKWAQERAYRAVRWMKELQ